jgi:hypothetical protein
MSTVISASTTLNTAYNVVPDTSGSLAFATGASPTVAMTISSAQVVTFANQPAYTGGTINGVAYLNGSKVLTTGSALVFDGTNLGIGTSSPTAQLHVKNGGGNSISILGQYGTGTIAQMGAYANQVDIKAYNGTNDVMTFTTGASERMRIDSSGNVGIGTSSPQSTFQVGSVNAGTSESTNKGLVQIQSAPSTIDAAGGLEFKTSSSGSGYGWKIGGLNAAGDPFVIGNRSNSATFTERARIDASGNFLLGRTDSVARFAFTGYVGTGAGVGLSATWNGDFFGYACDAGSFNAALAGVKIQRVASTNRSLNAAGTINASGADYAEYMHKAGDFVIAKGDVVGIDANGKLTNVFADAISFVVKSTDPSYVGGDTWSIAEMPNPVPNDASDEDKTQYAADFAQWSEAHEIERASVDRIAFSGQVPVNVLGAVAGQYIVPVNDNGAIKGEAVSNPTFEQYQQAVGKVIAIEQDGRARIIVKVA